MTRTLRRTLIAVLALVALPAVAQTMARVATEHRQYVALATGSSKTCLSANANRHGWSVMMMTSAGVANAAVAYMTTSTQGGITQTARSTNGTPLAGGASWGEDGSGGTVYWGPVTVLGTTGDGCNAREW